MNTINQSRTILPSKIYLFENWSGNYILPVKNERQTQKIAICSFIVLQMIIALRCDLKVNKRIRFVLKGSYHV